MIPAVRASRDKEWHMEGFDFAAWLRAMGLTKEQAAAALGVSASYVSKMAARPRSTRYRPITLDMVRRCGDVARRRAAEIEPYTML